MDNTVKFDVKSVCDGHHNMTYRGIRCLKCPFDYVIYQMIINQVQPDLIIEIGTNAGGSALYMADLLDKINKGIIHTIDIQNMVTNEAIIQHPRIKRFLGGYSSYNLQDTLNYEKVLVIDDGSHTYEDVMNSLNMFKNVVSKHSYFIVEDGIIDELGYQGYNGGPLRAIKEFLESNSDFRIDRKWCDMFGTNATFNVNGYLRKV
jgi:cephalosporin hydroxylase